MYKLLFFSLIITLVSCTENKNQSIKLNVNNTVQIPVEYVTIMVTINEYGAEPTSVERNGYESLSKVVNLLQDNGIPNDEVEISAGELTTQYYRTTDPYEFRSTLTFDLTDLEKIDTFRRAIVGVGGTSFRISSYGNNDEESIYDNAYRDAINNARKRAERLLSNQPVKIGVVLNLHENVHEIVETIEIIETNQVDNIIELEAAFDLPYIESMFNKKFYTKTLRFNVEFELLQQ
ncbi:MAG: SIMPL domain-containing protein [Balneolales bacterium]|nr:SIMPL domain-containing protein [Balneolales bacterium]